MTDFLNRLRAYLDAPATMQLAQAAPLGILAGASAAVIAAVIGMPAFATSGLGLIFGGLAVNFTSSLIDKIVHAGGERERTRLIAQGLAASDPDVQALVAGALTHAGPAVAAALPAADRDELIVVFEQAMRASGGPLTAIAARYGAALRSPGADWHALRAELHAELATVTQIIRGETLVEGATQHVKDVDGTAKQLIEAEAVRNVAQVAIGVRGSRHPAPPPAPPAAPPAPSPDGDRARHGEAGDPTVNGGPPGADPVRHPGDAGGGAGV